MQLLQEIIEHVKPVIQESTATSPKMYFIEGPFLQADIKNRNGRIYPMRTLAEEVKRYTREIVKENRALGELGHPDSPQINLPLVSHIITELTQDGSNFSGRAKILDTPNGKIVKSLIDENIKLGVSSRGVGSLSQTSNGNIVGEDFYLATAADIVADPSAPNAFVRGIMEGREWVWDNGILTESQVAMLKKEVEAAPRKKAEARQLDEAVAWDKFFKLIRVGMTLPVVQSRRLVESDDDDDDDGATYKIIRFKFNGSPRTIQRGLSLADAQAHCKDPKTHGEGWFDGYDKE
jgi:hypothetical protein